MNEPASRADQSLDLLRQLVATGKETNRLLRLLLPEEAARVATDEELDGPRGDPIVKVVPKSWKGDNFKGRKLSECSTEFLKMIASFFDWSAGKKREAGEAKYADYAELDAARARGWLRRKLAAPAVITAPPDDENDANEEDDKW